MEKIEQIPNKNEYQELIEESETKVKNLQETLRRLSDKLHEGKPENMSIEVWQELLDHREKIQDDLRAMIIFLGSTIPQK